MPEKVIAMIAPADYQYRTDNYKLYDVHQECRSFTGCAWKGERICSLILLLAEKREVKNIYVTTTDFLSDNQRLSASIVKLGWLRETKAYTGRYGRWTCEKRKESVADIIDPSFPIDLKPGQLKSIWVNIDIPRNAVPGVYRGKLKIQSESLDQELNFDYTVEVLNLLQPEGYLSLELWQYPYSTARYYNICKKEYFKQRHLEILSKHMELYKKAGGTSIAVTICEDPWASQTFDPYPSMIQWIKGKDKKIRFSYTHFDTYVGLALLHGVCRQLKCFSLIPMKHHLELINEADGKKIRITCKPGSRRWKRYWSCFLESFVQHLDEKGWFDITYIALDECPQNAIQKVLSMISAYRNREGKSLKVYSAINQSFWGHPILDEIDEVSIGLEQVKESIEMKKFTDKRRKLGKTTTLYTCCGQYPNSFARSEPSESAWCIWYAQYLGMDGFMRWALDAWVEEPINDISHWYWESGDPFLIYPGERKSDYPAPRSTPRFERLMEGIRDVNKIRYLSQISEKAAEECSALLQNLGRAYGSLNSFGAMEAGSLENKKFIASQVQNMRKGLEIIAHNYLSGIGLTNERERG